MVSDTHHLVLAWLTSIEKEIVPLSQCSWSRVLSIQEGKMRMQEFEVCLEKLFGSAS